MQRKNTVSSLTFKCFSPPVMMATFVAEIVLATYHLFRYKLTQVVRLAVALLFFLALFQIAEYFVCGGLGMSRETWSKIGYVAITTLPPLGMHMIHVIAKKKSKLLPGLAYFTGAAFIAYFLGYTEAFKGYQCTGNYVIFQLGQTPAIMYGAYYYGWLVVTIALSMKWRLQAAVKAPAKRALMWMVVGYLLFMVPTALVNTINNETSRGIPSIMCGFAIFFAAVLTLKVIPNAVTKKDYRI